MTIAITRSLAVAAALLTIGLPTSAATFNITMAGQTTTFEAPAAGGAISNFMITIGGVTFDTLLGGNDAPTYNLADNDLKGADGGIFSYVTNSAAAPGCLVLDCRLEFEDRADPEIPPVWAAFSLTDLEVFASGFYVIAPARDTPDGVVPVPPALALMLGGLAALAGLGRRRS